MGGTTFTVRARGATAQEAFQDAVAQAQYEHGHGGYSGTIAEKREFTLINQRPGVTAAQQASDMIDEEDARINDKWGPAGCIDMGGGEYLFFGWASC